MKLSSTDGPNYAEGYYFHFATLTLTPVPETSSTVLLSFATKAGNPRRRHWLQR
jgi:hypothetical protein